MDMILFHIDDHCIASSNQMKQLTIDFWNTKIRSKIPLIDNLYKQLSQTVIKYFYVPPTHIIELPDPLLDSRIPVSFIKFIIRFLEMQTVIIINFF
jgi:hypothetical protein